MEVKASIGAEMVRLQAFALLREMEFLLWTAFPNDDSVYRLIYLGLEQISRKWTMPIRNWKAALQQFAILYEDRLPLEALGVAKT